MHTLSSPQSTRMWACVVQTAVRNNLGKPESHPFFFWKVWTSPQIKPKPSFRSACFCPTRHPSWGSDLSKQPNWHNGLILIHSAVSLKEATLAVFGESQTVLLVGVQECRQKWLGLVLRSQERCPGPDWESTIQGCQGPTCWVTVFSL